ncbi:eukaryotic translation initiation factor 4 gamma 2-like [Centruroides sculpturatus]|uniref:eukaryotic translation initiation factor 4 gamma 2-like n=1 Tax=Centruroides sculpturatus TaxID=218467 RepID=UPI000C6D3E23|nr:eukaryotic translation initiation factor 4 gamma 2-like [Centruroides sculpturatus]
MYAQLCHKLCEEAPNFDFPSNSSSSHSSNNNNSSNTFRRLLLAKCQDEFENRRKTSEAFDKKDGPLSAEEEEQRAVAKHKMLGNIKFIGELGKQGLLQETILHQCVHQLLLKKKRQSLKDMAEDLECLCQIMKTVGHRLDTEKAKARMDQYFDRMKTLANNNELPSRIRFMLQDVLELRQNKWIPRRVLSDHGPKTIQQVREEAARDYGVYIPPPAFSSRNMPVPSSGMLAGKMRGGMDDVFSHLPIGVGLGTGPGVIPTDNFPAYSSNMGRPNRSGGLSNTGFLTTGGTGSFYGQNRNKPIQNRDRDLFPNYQQQRQTPTQNQHMHGFSGSPTINRDVPPRFLKKALQQQTGNLDEISLRPAQNSILLKSKPMAGSFAKPVVSSIPLVSGSAGTDTSVIRDFSSGAIIPNVVPNSLQKECLLGFGKFVSSETSNYQFDAISFSLKIKTFDKKDGPLSAEEEEQRAVAKHKMLGNIKFIGELGKQGLLQETILHQCVHQLLLKKKRQSLKDMAEDLECLCQIMKTVGHRLDTEKAKARMDQYFDRFLTTGGTGSFYGQNRNKPIQNRDRDLFPNYQQQRQTPTQNQHMHGFSGSPTINRDVPPRFLKKALQQQTGNLDEISLRPAQNSILLKSKPMAGSFAKPVVSSIPLVSGSAGTDTSVIRDFSSGAIIPNVVPNSLQKETQVVVKQSTQDKNKANKQGPSKEEVMKKAIPLNYFYNKFLHRFLADVIIMFMLKTLEKSESDRECISRLLAMLKKDAVLHNNVFLEAMKAVFQQMSDLEAEVPRVKSYVAGFAARGIADNIVLLGEIAEPLEGGAHYPLFLLCLQQLHKTQGRTWLDTTFNQSKINLLSMLPEMDRTKERLADILEDRGLGFLFPLLRIQADLWKQIQSDKSPNSLYRWIKENVDVTQHSVPGFVNALVSCLIKFITQETTLAEGIDYAAVPDKTLTDKEKELLMKFKPVFLAFLQEHPDLQLITLYALQVHCYNNSFPKGMMLRWFISFYELEIVEEEAFLKWKEDVNDEYPGKGKALFQVNQWLTWLEEAEEEEGSDEGDN